MRPAGARGLVALLVLLFAAAAAGGVPLAPSEVQVLVGERTSLPADDDPAWQPARAPDARAAPVAWYRVAFDAPASAVEQGWMLYLPYLYGGGQLWLNAQPVTVVLESRADLRVRWERPLLLPLPQAALRAGRNVLHLRAVSAGEPGIVFFPALKVGSQAELQGLFDRRFFVVRTLPQVTLVAGMVVGLLVVSIWWRRRQEVQYGLFGLAAILWALRTTTFIFDLLPAALWPLWRMLYYASTGGFIAAMALFTASLAGRFDRRLAWALAGYVLLGPLLYGFGGDRGDALAGRWWVLGLVPMGVSVAVFSLTAAWRERTPGNALIAATVALATLAGVHDYLLASGSTALASRLPEWTGDRIFLLHHAANLMLLVMGLLLSARFVHSLQAVEHANETLEARVAEREREIATSYERIAVLQREQAVQDERQRMVQDLHDGLGSQLFSSLMRAERGALDSAAAAVTLRGAIDEMRVAIEALTPDDRDFRTAFGNFRFRWDQRLRDAGLEPSWHVDLPDAPLVLSPDLALQVLRVVQESLTNVLKHARATEVQVRLSHRAGELELDVIDNGGGTAAATQGGRGLANMRTRAARLGGRLQVEFGRPGARVVLAVPLRAT